MTAAGGYEERPEGTEGGQESLTVAGYLSWARHLLNSEGDFAPLREAFPEVGGKDKPFDAVMATVNNGEACVLAFKKADSLSYTQMAWHLNQLLDMIPKPAALDTIGYYGALILVFEGPLDPVKRDRLVSMRKNAFLGQRSVQIMLVELQARATWTMGLPRTVQPLLWPLEDAMSRKGEPPPLVPKPRRLGHHGSRAPVLFATIGLSAALWLVHMLVFLTAPGDSTGLRLFRAGARHTGAIVDGEFWRLLTPSYLHASWDHLVFNLLCFFEFGRIAEPLFGGGWLVALFVLTGLFSMAFSWVISPEFASVGSSGSVYGLFGVMAGVYILRRKRLSFRFQGHATRLFRAFILYNLYFLIRSLITGGGIDHYAHLGGFLGGLVLGLVLPFQENERVKRLGGWLGIGCAAASLLAAIVVLGNRGAGDQGYVPLSDGHLKVSLERPGGFVAERKEDGSELTITNGLYATIKVSRPREQHVWMLERGADEVRKFIEEHWLDVTELEVNEVRVQDLRGMRIRFVTGGGLMRRTVEDLYFPQRTGSLWVRMSAPRTDEAYYRPLFQRVRSSLASDYPPAVNLPE